MRPGRRSRVDAKLLLTSMSLPRHRSGLSGPEHPDSGRTIIRRHRQNHPDAFRRGGGTPRLDGGRSARPMWRSCCPRPGRGSSARLRCRSTMSGDPLVTPASHASCWVDRFALSHDARRTGPVVRGPDLARDDRNPRTPSASEAVAGRPGCGTAKTRMLLQPTTNARGPPTHLGHTQRSGRCFRSYQGKYRSAVQPPRSINLGLPKPVNAQMRRRIFRRQDVAFGRPSPRRQGSGRRPDLCDRRGPCTCPGRTVSVLCETTRVGAIPQLAAITTVEPSSVTDG